MFGRKQLEDNGVIPADSPPCNSSLFSGPRSLSPMELKKIRFFFFSFEYFIFVDRADKSFMMTKWNLGKKKQMHVLKGAGPFTEFRVFKECEVTL